MPGWWDKLTGTKRPEADVPAQPRDAVLEALLALGDDARADGFLIRRAEPDEGVDLVAESDLADPRWEQQIGRMQRNVALRILMRLDEAEHEVRNVQEERKVEVRKGLLSWTAEKTYDRGNVVSKGGTWTIGGDGVEKTSGWDFQDVEDPLRDATLAAGWTWKTVPFGKVTR